MRTRAAAHDEIARALEFPPHYGRNLDALWDLLTTIEARVTLENPAPMLNALEAYGCKLLSAFFEAAQENADLQFRVSS